MIDTPRDFIAHLVGAQTDNSSDPLDLLEDVEAGYSSPGELNDRHDIGEKTIYRALEPLTEDRLLLHPDGAYEKTGLGAVLQHAFSTALATPGLTRDTLGYLTASHYRVPLLCNVRSESTGKASLSLGEEAPSRSTVHRALRRFEDEGWIARDSEGDYELTPAGEQVLDAYSTLADEIRHAGESAEFLYGCDTEVADIPLDALSDAESYTHTPTTPDRLRGRCKALADSDLTKFRALLSKVSFSNAEIGDRIIRSNVDTEVIITERVLYNLPTEGEYTEHVKRGLQAENFRLLVAPERDVLPVGLAMYDDTVLLGPGTNERVPRGAPVGTVVSSDETLVGWADDLYAEYREQARSPPRHVVNRIFEAISERIPLRESLPEFGKGKPQNPQSGD